LALEQAGGKQALCHIFEPLITAGFLMVLEADIPTTAAFVNSSLTDKVGKCAQVAQG
jgi:hypothetical protein